MNYTPLLPKLRRKDKSQDDEISRRFFFFFFDKLFMYNSVSLCFFVLQPPFWDSKRKRKTWRAVFFPLLSKYPFTPDTKLRHQVLFYYFVVFFGTKA